MTVAIVVYKGLIPVVGRILTVFEDVLGIGEVTRGAFVGIRKRVHLMPNLKGSPATDNCNRDIILKK